MNIEQLFNKLHVAIATTSSADDYHVVLADLSSLAKLVKAAPDDEDMWYIGENVEFTLDALIAGAWHFCVDYHSGQNSPEYALQCELGSIYQANGNSCEEYSPEHDVCLLLEQLHNEAYK